MHWYGLDIVWREVDRMAQGVLQRLPHFLLACLVFGVFLLFARLTRGAVHRVRAQRQHKNLTELLSRLASAAIQLFGFLIAAVVLFPNFNPGDLVAGLGITSIAIGFAFKDILQNFLAGILILWREPFRIGDQIRSGEWEGTVEAINTRSTRIRTYDGERAVLPNADVYTRAILVRTAYPQRRVRFTVGIGYSDSIEDARSAIHDVLKRTEGVHQQPEPWVYVSELAPSSVNLIVYFWTNSQQADVLRVSDAVATGIKQALDKAEIDMPYPHTVVLLQDVNGRRSREDAPLPE